MGAFGRSKTSVEKTDREQGIVVGFSKEPTEAEQAVERNIQFTYSLIARVEDGSVVNERQNSLWRTYHAIEFIKQNSQEVIEQLAAAKVPAKKLAEFEQAAKMLNSLVQEKKIWEQATKKGLTLTPPAGSAIKAALAFEDRQVVNTAQAKFKFSLDQITKVAGQDSKFSNGLKELEFMNDTERAQAFTKFEDSLNEYVEFLSTLRSEQDISKIDVDQIQATSKQYEDLMDHAYTVRALAGFKDNAMPTYWSLAESLSESFKKAKIIFAVYKNPEGRSRLFSVPK
jgi:pimeloyl-CoA synthetase